MDSDNKEAVAARSGAAAKTDSGKEKPTVDPNAGSGQKVADSTIKALNQDGVKKQQLQSGEIDYDADIPDGDRDARIRENIENASAATSHPAVKKLLANALKDLDARAAK